MSQSIDLSAVTDATFNGSAVEQINLNGAGVWTKPPQGYSVNIFGLPPAQQITYHGNGNLNPPGSFAWDYKTEQTHALEHGEAWYGAGLFYDKYSDGTRIESCNVHRGMNQWGLSPLGIMDDNGIIQVYMSVSQPISDFGWDIRRYSHATEAHSIPTGVSALNYNDIYAKAYKNRHQGLQSGLDSSTAIYHNIIMFPEWTPYKPYRLYGGHSMSDDPALNEMIHIGHYDATMTFIVDSVFNTMQEIYIPYQYPGRYGVESITTRFWFEKTASNKLKIYQGTSAGGPPSSGFGGTYAEFAGPVNGNLSCANIYYGCGASICGMWTWQNIWATGTGSARSQVPHDNQDQRYPVLSSWINGKLTVTDPANSANVRTLMEFT